MHDDHGNHQNPGGGYGGQMREALDRIRSLVVDGPKHEPGGEISFGGLDKQRPITEADIHRSVWNNRV